MKPRAPEARQQPECCLMCWPTREGDRRRLQRALIAHARNKQPLPGMAEQRALEPLAEQIVASLRRESYYRAVQRKLISAARADPHSASFDPERAVAYWLQQGDPDKAA